MIAGYGEWSTPSPDGRSARQRTFTRTYDQIKRLLDNVYNCSSNMHSGSGIGRGSSVNCWNTIAADLALAVS